MKRRANARVLRREGESLATSAIIRREGNNFDVPVRLEGTDYVAEVWVPDLDSIWVNGVWHLHGDGEEEVALESEEWRAVEHAAMESLPDLEELLAMPETPRVPTLGDRARALKLVLPRPGFDRMSPAQAALLIEQLEKRAAKDAKFAVELDYLRTGRTEKYPRGGSLDNPRRQGLKRRLMR